MKCATSHSFSIVETFIGADRGLVDYAAEVDPGSWISTSAGMPRRAWSRRIIGRVSRRLWLEDFSDASPAADDWLEVLA